jgi:hypothetical protein
LEGRSSYNFAWHYEHVPETHAVLDLILGNHDFHCPAKSRIRRYLSTSDE